MRVTSTISCVLVAAWSVACRFGYELHDLDQSGAGGATGDGVTTTGASGSPDGGVMSGDSSSDASSAGGVSGSSDSSTSSGSGASANGATTGAGGAATGGDAGSGSGTGGSSGSVGTGGSGASTGCSPTNGGVEICDGLDNDCANGADDGVTCPTDCTGVTFGGNGYQFCDSIVEWQTAWDNCETQGMHLVRVDSDAENTFIATTAFATALDFVWLGGDDLTTEGTWLWQDGTLFWTGGGSGTAPPGVYTNWYPGYPRTAGETDCLELRDDYAWNDKQCIQGKRYVCETLYL